MQAKSLRFNCINSTWIKYSRYISNFQYALDLIGESIHCRMGPPSFITRSVGSAWPPPPQKWAGTSVWICVPEPKNRLSPWADIKRWPSWIKTTTTEEKSSHVEILHHFLDLKKYIINGSAFSLSGCGQTVIYSALRKSIEVLLLLCMCQIIVFNSRNSDVC